MLQLRPFRVLIAAAVGASDGPDELDGPDERGGRRNRDHLAHSRARTGGVLALAALVLSVSGCQIQVATPTTFDNAGRSAGQRDAAGGGTVPQDAAQSAAARPTPGGDGAAAATPTNAADTILPSSGETVSPTDTTVGESADATEAPLSPSELPKAESAKQTFLPTATRAFPTIDPTLGSGTEVRTYYIGPRLMDCTANTTGKCFEAREGPSGPWSPLADQIEGFDYAPGFEYMVRVAITTVPSSLAGGSRRRVAMIEFKSKTPATHAGTATPR